MKFLKLNRQGNRAHAKNMLRFAKEEARKEKKLLRKELKNKTK